MRPAGDLAEAAVCDVQACERVSRVWRLNLMCLDEVPWARWQLFRRRVPRASALPGWERQLAAVSALRLVKLVVVEPYEISCEKVAVAQSAVALRVRPEGRQEVRVTVT